MKGFLKYFLFGSLILLLHHQSVAYSGPDFISTTIRDGKPPVITLEKDFDNLIPQNVDTLYIRYKRMVYDAGGNLISTGDWIENFTRTDNSFLLLDDPNGALISITPGLYKIQIMRQETLAVDVIAWEQLIYVPSVKPAGIEGLARQYFPTVVYHEDESYFPVSLEELFSHKESNTDAFEAYYVSNVLGSRYSPKPGDDLTEFLSKNGHSDNFFNFSAFDSTCSLTTPGCTPHFMRSGAGSHIATTIYWDADQVGNELFLTYYFFYGFDPKIGTMNDPHSAGHVFDREAFTIRFQLSGNNYLPKEIIYAGHLETQDLKYKADDAIKDNMNVLVDWSGGKTKLDWANAQKIGDSPVIYKAKGAHAIYPALGNYVVDNNKLLDLIDNLLEPAGSIGSLKVIFPDFLDKIQGNGTRFATLENLDYQLKSFLSFSGGIIDVLGFGNVKFPPFIRTPYKSWIDFKDNPTFPGSVIADFDECLTFSSSNYDIFKCSEVRKYFTENIKGLEKYAAITVVVVDENGNPVSDAIVNLTRDSNQEWYSRTVLPNGKYIFSFIPSAGLSYGIKLKSISGNVIDVACETDINYDVYRVDRHSKIVTCTYDFDTDNDGVNNFDDNCPLNSNSDQSNYDKDSQGDICDDDDDNDGIPDYWEIKYKLNPKNKADASLDSDGDGRTNLQEYKDDTNPNQKDKKRKVYITPVLSLLLLNEEKIKPVNGLIAHYKFDGNMIDSSTQENHGIEHGGLTYVSGINSEAAKFDGIDDWVDLSKVGDVSKFTVNVWAMDDNPDNFTSQQGNNGDSEYYGIVYKGALSSAGYDFYVGKAWTDMHMRSGNSPAFNFYAHGGNRADSNVIENEWSMYTYVFESGKSKIYRNGELISEDISTVQLTNIYSNWYIARRWLFNGTTTYWKGVMDNLRIYNRSLSQAEITQHYNQSQ